MVYSNQCADFINKKSIHDSPEILLGYSKDLSPISPRKPDLVVKPKNNKEVEKLVKWANKENVPLIPVSSKSPGLRGATIPRLGGVIVDLSEMDNIVRIDKKNRIVLIEPGVTFRKLIPELDNNGLRLQMPLLPPAEKSVLAWALEREPTIMPRYHWDITDPLLCMEVVFGNGDTLRTGEAAGPGSLEKQWEHGGAQKFPLGPHQVDYHRLVQGSQGTMGIATWATIKCEIKPALQRCFFVTADKAEGLTDFAYQMMKLDLADELFIVNNLTLATILTNDPNEIQSIKESLPQWILVFAIAGLEYLADERISYRSQDVMENAEKFGVKVSDSLNNIEGKELLNILSQPSSEPYWKLRYKGGCQEIFFTNTLDNAQNFIDSMNTLAATYDYPTSNIGIYIQPMVQGTSAHVEFDLFYNPEDICETKKATKLHKAAVDTLMKEGGFFNRPYPFIADRVFGRYAEHSIALRKVKNIFDPNHIMNPGKLCF